MVLNVTREIDVYWTEYDKSVAKSQLNNYGVIYLDEFGCPIDNVYLTDDLHEELKGAIK